MPYYVDAEDLSRQVRDCQEQNTLTAEFIRSLRLIMLNYAKRFHQYTDEDMVQDLCLKMLTDVKRLDPALNCFSYLTACAKTIVVRSFRARQRRSKVLRLEDVELSGG